MGSRDGGFPPFASLELPFLFQECHLRVAQLDEDDDDDDASLRLDSIMQEEEEQQLQI